MAEEPADLPRGGLEERLQDRHDGAQIRTDHQSIDVMWKGMGITARCVSCRRRRQLTTKEPAVVGPPDRVLAAKRHRERLDTVTLRRMCECAGAK